RLCPHGFTRRQGKTGDGQLAGASPPAIIVISTVAVAQLVESRIVIPVVVGSSPISHPKTFKAPACACIPSTPGVCLWGGSVAVVLKSDAPVRAVAKRLVL